MSSLCLTSLPHILHTDAIMQISVEGNTHFVFTICFGLIQAEQCTAAVYYKVDAAASNMHAHIFLAPREKHTEEDLPVTHICLNTLMCSIAQVWSFECVTETEREYC